MLDCETCRAMKTLYEGAVTSLREANEQLRAARPGTLQAAMSRRDVHEALQSLIAAEAELKAHKNWHIETLMAIAATAR